MELYVDLSSLDVRLAHFLIGPLLRLLLQRFLPLCCIRLEYLESDQSDEPEKEESKELGSESGSFGTCITGLGGFLRGIEFPVDVTLAGNDRRINCG